MIVGGGPAGATTALNLAPFQEVLVVEGRTSPTSRIGESLAPAARRLLSDMGLWEEFLAQGHAPCYGNRSVWGSEAVTDSASLRDLDGPGWHLDRARFEAWLRTAARRRGARFLSPARLSAIRSHGEGWIVDVEEEGERTSVHCRFLVDATGRSSSAARRLGVARNSLDRLSCGWLYGHDGGDAVSQTTFVEATDEGWWYTAPLPGGRRILAFHSDADLPAARTLRCPVALVRGAAKTGRLASLLRETAFAPRAEHGVLVASGSRLVSFAGDGWLAVGDAAMAFDPISSQGLFNALYSGLLGAEFVYRRFAGENTDPQEYGEAMLRIWAAYVNHRSTWYGLERRWPQSVFWLRRHGRDTIPPGA